MKNIIFCFIFVFIGFNVYSQTWTLYIDADVDYEFTAITQEQFDRIIRAQETTATAVWLTYIDEVQMREGRLIDGSIPHPHYDGYYYESIRYIPKSARSREYINSVTSVIRYGNTRTGWMEIRFYNVWWPDYNISLRNNRNEYARRYNHLIRLVNGE